VSILKTANIEKNRFRSELKSAEELGFVDRQKMELFDGENFLTATIVETKNDFYNQTTLGASGHRLVLKKPVPELAKPDQS
jgi:hypothetical protein